MLRGINVLQFQGLAPSVFCGHYFADQGAEVTIIARNEAVPFSMPLHLNLMNRYKKCICLSLKNKQDKSYLVQMVKKSHIVIDSYRPGVLEKLGLGPDQLFKLNKSIIILRVSGYGQEGTMSKRPGHDLNYISVSGILPLINQDSSQIQFPTNMLADFISSSLGITGTLVALEESRKTGIGKVVDLSLCDGCKYYSKIISISGDKEEKKIEFIKIGQKQYCISSSKVEEVKKLVSNSKILLEKIGTKKYWKMGDTQISQVAQVPSWDSSLKERKNPFDSKPFQLVNQLPERGQDTEVIKKMYQAKL